MSHKFSFKASISSLKILTVALATELRSGLVFCLDIETLISEFYTTLFIQIRITLTGK